MGVSRDDEGKKIYNDVNPGLGFHKPGKWQEIVRIDQCHLVPENVNGVL